MKFVVATNNEHKLQEIQRILLPLGIEALSQKQAGASVEVEETGSTFEENAFLKAQAVAKATGLPAVADDSGLAVTALGGRPGIYSARYAGEGASDADRIRKLLKELEACDTQDRSAKFVSAVCCYFSEDDWFCVRGECPGVIAHAPMGEGGFGYDPVFFLPEEGKTFGQLTPQEKDGYSHRGRALRAMQEKLRDRLA